jgi:hypothetical protein
MNASQGDATILPQGMSPDKKDSIIINYNRSEAIMFRPLRDEIRKVRCRSPGPSLILLMV